MFEDLLQPPTIPLDFTEDEIQEAKDYAYRQLNPTLRVKSVRMKLPDLIKMQIVNELSQQFDLAVEKIRERKNEVSNI